MVRKIKVVLLSFRPKNVLITKNRRFINSLFSNKLFSTELPTSGFNRRSSTTHVDSPVTSENGSTSGISGSGSSNGSDATLVNAEETYTSSLFQTEPLYQFYDVSGGSHTIKVRFFNDEYERILKS